MMITDALSYLYEPVSHLSPSPPSTLRPQDWLQEIVPLITSEQHVSPLFFYLFFISLSVSLSVTLSLCLSLSSSR
jgi:hypothetical protein